MCKMYSKLKDGIMPSWYIKELMGRELSEEDENIKRESKRTELTEACSC